MNISHKDTKVPTKAQRRVSPFFVPSALTLRLCVNCLLLVFLISAPTFAQHPGPRTSRAHPTMSAEAKALLDEAIGVVGTQAKLDPKSSIAIDEMQARPSLPLQSPEARAGAERAQRLLPLTKNLTVAGLGQPRKETGLGKSPTLSQAQPTASP